MKTEQTSSHVSAPKLGGIRPEDQEDITAFFDSLQRKSPKTQATYREAAQMLAAYTASKGMPLLENLEREHLEDFFNWLHSKGNAPATIRNRQASLRALFNWMIEADLRKQHPMARIKLEHLPEKVQVDYKADEVAAVLGAIKSNDVLALRDRAVIMFLLDSGLRAAELCSLRVGDLDREGRRANVVGKGGKERVIRYGAATAGAIFKYVRRRGGFDSLGPKAPLFAQRSGEAMTFNGLRTFLERRFKAAGVEFGGIHGFRRSFAISYLNSGGDALSLKQLAGWNGLQMVYKYVRRSEQERALRSYDDFSPVDHMLAKGRKA